MVTPSEPAFDITVKENPARRLQAIMESAGYQGPAEFIVKALDVFEQALRSGGKVVVEDEHARKKYVFHITTAPGFQRDIKAAKVSVAGR